MYNMYIHVNCSYMYIVLVMCTFFDFSFVGGLTLKGTDDNVHVYIPSSTV